MKLDLGKKIVVQVSLEPLTREPLFSLVSRSIVFWLNVKISDPLWDSLGPIRFPF
jgi:hypothetical protein